MILVDSSVWIDFFNGKEENQKVATLTELLKNGKEVFVTDIIVTEILQ